MYIATHGSGTYGIGTILCLAVPRQQHSWERRQDFISVVH